MVSKKLLVFQFTQKKSNWLKFWNVSRALVIFEWESNVVESIRFIDFKKIIKTTVVLKVTQTTNKYGNKLNLLISHWHETISKS